MNIRDKLRDWLTEYAQPHTRRAYQHDLEAFLDWCEGRGLDPLDLDRPDVNAYRDSLVKTMAATTVDRRMSACRSFFTYLVEEQVAADCAFRHVKRLARPGESTTPWLGGTELTRLLEAAREKNRRDFILAALLGLNGLRISEALGADVADLGTSGGHRVLRVLRKGRKAGVVPLSPLVLDDLDTYLDGRTRGPLIARLTRTGEVAEPVKPISREAAHKRIKMLAAWAGVNPAISPHSLRHSFITLSLANGSPLHVVQLGAGHSSPATTQHYNRDRDTLDSNPTFALAEGVLGAAR